MSRYIKNIKYVSACQQASRSKSRSVIVSYLVQALPRNMVASTYTEWHLRTEWHCMIMLSGHHKTTFHVHLPVTTRIIGIN